jgi:hypothetical protein
MPIPCFVDFNLRRKRRFEIDAKQIGKIADVPDHGCLPLGAEAQERKPWEEAPCFSGFSPQTFTASYC